MADDANTKTPEPKVETVSREEFDKVKAKAERYQSQVEDFERKYKGVDIDALKAAVEERDILRRQVEDKDWKAEDVIKKAEETAAKRFGTKLAEETERAARAEAKLRDHVVVSSTLTEAATLDLFTPDGLKLIENDVRRELDLQDDEIIVKNEKGEPRYSKADPNKRMSRREYLEELAQRYPSIARNQSAGGGKQSGGKGNGTPGRKYTYAEIKAMPSAQQKEVLATMTPAEQMALLR